MTSIEAMGWRGKTDFCMLPPQWKSNSGMFLRNEQPNGGRFRKAVWHACNSPRGRGASQKHGSCHAPKAGVKHHGGRETIMWKGKERREEQIYIYSLSITITVSEAHIFYHVYGCLYFYYDNDMSNNSGWGKYYHGYVPMTMVAMTSAMSLTVTYDSVWKFWKQTCVDFLSSPSEAWWGSWTFWLKKAYLAGEAIQWRWKIFCVSDHI